MANLQVKVNSIDFDERTQGPLTPVGQKRKTFEPFMSESPTVENWNTSEVDAWLENIGLSHYSPNFRKHKIDGFCLLKLNHTLLSKMEVDCVGDLVKIMEELEKLRDKRQKTGESKPEAPGIFTTILHR
jgi:hypothetical protein